MQQWTAKPSGTVRDAATSAWAAAWPPKTIGRLVGIWAPRNRLSSTDRLEVEQLDELVGVARHQPSPSAGPSPDGSGSVEPGEEPLELLAELLAGRDALLLRQQARPALSARQKASYWRSSASTTSATSGLASR